MELPKLLELEQELAADHQGTARDALMQELESARLKLNAVMRRGQTPDEYKRMAALVDAYAAAQVVVPVVWKRFNLGNRR